MLVRSKNTQHFFFEVGPRNLVYGTRGETFKEARRYFRVSMKFSVPALKGLINWQVGEKLWIFFDIGSSPPGREV